MPITALIQDVAIPFLQNMAEQSDDLLVFVIDRLGDWYETGVADLAHFSIEWYQFSLDFLENPVSQRSFVLLQVSACTIVAVKVFFANGIIQKAWSGILISVAYTVWAARDLKSLCDQNITYRDLNRDLRAAIGVVGECGGSIGADIDSLLTAIMENKTAAEESRVAAESNHRAALELESQIARLKELHCSGSS